AVFGKEIEVYNYFAAFKSTFTGEGSIMDRIILPVGISFYTFQAISYTTDIYRRKIEPLKNIFDFGFFVSFFPQLVAGPIVRASEFIPQIHRTFHLSGYQFGLAVFMILNGLIKK
ncbi:MAG: MBOAT family protein, partial [bacterium]